MSRSPTTRRVSPIRGWQRRPYRYALALVLACASIIALVLLYADQSISLEDKASQVGAGLAASIIFAVIYTVLANREYSELIRSEIEHQLTGHLTEVLHHIKQLNQAYLPTDQYAATKDFDERFNKDLSSDLCHSSFYFFRGTSAKYIPARLDICEHHLEKAQVVLLDPRDKNTIEARARDRRRRPEYHGKSLLIIEEEIKNEILIAVVALFDCRDQCTIEIGFSTATSPVRIEVFDDAIYTSLYTSPDSQRNTHPEAARFSRDSQTYQIFRDECRRQLQLASSRRIFTTREEDRDLSEFLESLEFTGTGPAELNEVRSQYKTFIEPFSEALKAIGAGA
jgi:hypothetical protein